jgi:hypothetical protein
MKLPNKTKKCEMKNSHGLTRIKHGFFAGALALTLALATQAAPPAFHVSDTLDINDRSGRLLGHVTLDNSALAVTGTFWQATQPVSGTVTATGTFWQATQPVSLATAPSTPVTGTFWQTTQPVSGTVAATGTFWQTTQPVSLATAPTTPVTGTFWQATQPVSLATAPSTPVTGTFWQTTQPVSATFWQATQPVSIASMPSTPVTGTFWQTTQPVSGTVTANAGTNLNTSALALDATLTGGTQKAIARGGAKGATSAADITSTANGADHQGIDVQLQNSSVAVTATFWQATQPVSLATAPTTPVTGTFWQTTQPVSATFWQATQPVSLATAPTTPVTGTFWQTTQPVSGAVTANAGTNLNTSSLALDATLTGGTQQTKITDGTNVGSVKAASTAAVATDKALVVAVSPNNSVGVTGTFWQATQPVSAASLPLPSGAATSAKQPALGTAGSASADAITVQGVASMTPLKVDGSAVTQPVSAASLPLPSGASTSAKQPALGTAGSASADAITVQGVASMTPLLVSGTFWQLSQPVSQGTLTKGTQGATGVSTQNLKDAGRVYCNFAGANPVTGNATEALITLTPYRDLTAGSTATTFAVTSGKRLRLQQLVVTWRNNTAAAGGVTVRLRLLAGTVLVTSPVNATLNATTSLATIGSGQTAILDLPDGLELSGTMQLGLTQLAVGAVVGFDVNLIGFEY